MTHTWYFETAANLFLHRSGQMLLLHTRYFDCAVVLLVVVVVVVMLQLLVVVLQLQLVVVVVPLPLEHVVPHLLVVVVLVVVVVVVLHHHRLCGWMWTRRNCLVGLLFLAVSPLSYPCL